MQIWNHLYQNDKRILAWSETLKLEAKLEYTLSKTSFDAVAFSQIVRKLGGRHLFIFPTQEEANDVCHDLTYILENETSVEFLETSFIIKNKCLEFTKHRLSRRRQVLESFQQKQNTVLVTTYEGLIEKISYANKEEWSKQVQKGDKIQLNEWIEFLEKTGYERSNYVYEYGQYAIRGNIVDIYSYAYPNPLRFELFDVEIEEIREFDLETQLSLYERESASIAPSPSLFHKNKQIQRLPLTDTLKENDTLWVIQEERFTKKLHEIAHSFQSYEGYEEWKDEFITEKDVLSNRTPQRVNISNTKKQDNLVPAPIIHKNFNKLYQSLKENIASGYQTYILSDDLTQTERYHIIFKDLGGDIPFESVEHELSKGFVDQEKKIAVFTTHEIFARRKRESTTNQINVSAQAQLLKSIKELVPGDFVTHIDHGVGRFSGLEKIDVGGHSQEAVRLIYANNDILYVHISSLHKISKYIGKEGTEPKMHRLGSDTWESVKRKTKKKIKDIAEDLIKLYAKRKASIGFAFSPDSYLQMELESSFEYEDTPDQAKATQDVKADMEREIPMDRLVCGDVGFGKTEIAIRAAFKAVADSKQVAVLVPTTLLAFQHYHTFKRRLDGLPCNVEFINRFKTAKEKSEILKRLSEGKVDILIGTHAIVGKNVKFKDMGLLIIDEEQKFGVTVKEKLKELKANVDTLTLTATPIPRTLQFSLLGARDYSLIQTPPPNRQAVYTEVTQLDPDYIQEIIHNEVSRGGQVFFVHNRVKDLAQMKDLLIKILPNLDIAMAHGQLDGEVIEQTIMDFIDKKYDVLLSTNIIESGIDIPNANTIIINNAQNFGLSDLHQLRGRVGRGDKKAYCYLLTPPYSTLTNEAKQRLNAMEQNAELGSGFQIAMRDLDLRGAGNLLGGEQSGFISDIGYDTFMKILDEAITELKEVDYKELYQDSQDKVDRQKDYSKECQIETDYDMYIPDSYISGSQERLNVYTELNALKSEKEMQSYLSRLKDIYGKLPPQIQEICDAIRLKWIATKLGIERIILKRGKMKCYLISNQESIFYQSEVFSKILGYIAQFPVGTSMKQTSQHIVLEFSHMNNCLDAKAKLEHILENTSK